MKTLLKTSLLTFLLVFVTSVFACRNTVPESEAQRYISAAALGESVPGGKSCAEAPGESCLCFDHCEGWDVCEVKDVEVVPEEGEPYTERKLVNNLDKLAAKRAAKDIEDNHREIAEAKKRQAKQKLKDLDLAELENATTIAGLRNALKKIIPEVVELLKE